MPKDYKNFNTDDFLNDAFFIEWVKHRTPVSNAFWQKWMDENHANLTLMKDAELQLTAFLSAQNIEQEEGARDQVWGRIMQTLQFGTVKNTRSRYGWWTAAAAAVLIVVSGVWFFTQHSKNREPLTAISNGTEISPGSNKAVLTLANGRQIELDSANTGMLISENGVQVIQMNEGIAYEATEMTTKIEYNTITTPRGGQYKVVLADGSQVWLNAESSLRFPTAFTGKERSVEMEGEAFFEVAEDTLLPFVVHTGGMQVQVLGTEFNVNGYDDQNVIRTTLVEGKVEVRADDQVANLLPGEQASLQKLNRQLSSAGDVDVEQIIAWKNGYFSFHDADLKQVMQQISRWYDIEVQYESQVPARKFEGIIPRNSELNIVLKILEESGVHFKIEGKKIIVNP